jgi:hypothetical protein
VTRFEEAFAAHVSVKLAMAQQNPEVMRGSSGGQRDLAMSLISMVAYHPG